LLLGSRVEPILKAHIAASGGRFSAIRFSTAWDADERVRKTVPRPGVLAENQFREGFQYLARFGLAFDAWVYHPQLGEVAALAADFPHTPIVLNHFGSPILGGPNAGRATEVFAEWRKAMIALASHDNVRVKLGALPERRSRTSRESKALPLSSEEIAGAWRPFFEVCLEHFGARRCMFESNFPVQKRWCSYAVLWNAFKRLASGASADEKSALFSGTAASIPWSPVKRFCDRQRRRCRHEMPVGVATRFDEAAVLVPEIGAFGWYSGARSFDSGAEDAGALLEELSA
jgi:hypothetical protein